MVGERRKDNEVKRSISWQGAEGKTLTPKALKKRIESILTSTEASTAIVKECQASWERSGRAIKAVQHPQEAEDAAPGRPRRKYAGLPRAD